MTTHRYHRRDLNADLLRACLGVAACVTPMFFIAPGAIATYVLAAPAIFFGLFGLRTWLHTRTVVTLDDAAIEMTGWGSARIPWQDLDTLKLSYFSTRRDREAGWMQLTLRAGGNKIALHSTLEGFEDICRQAFRVTQTRDIEMSDATARNFAVIGLGASDTTQHEKTPAALSGWGNPADWRR
ncbi:MAG: hypothetical protein HOJ90_01770 [Alphaproteobacteria bacterium]|nr:hypothetical protein [Alphaproteobacteria bacterium]